MEWNDMTRREVLSKTAGTFMILPAGLARGYAANDKLNVGVIGLSRGRSDTKALSDIGQNIAALCDVDATVLDRVGAESKGEKIY